MTSRTSKQWKWILSDVDINKEHIKITYGDMREESLQPIALIAPGRNKTFMVQFLVDKNRNEKTKEIVDRVCMELNFYLIEKGEKDPWAYAKYHCNTASNLYSPIHWHFFRGESDDPIKRETWP